MHRLRRRVDDTASYAENRAFKEHKAPQETFRPLRKEEANTIVAGCVEMIASMTTDTDIEAFALDMT